MSTQSTSPPSSSKRTWILAFSLALFLEISLLGIVNIFLFQTNRQQSAPEEFFETEIFQKAMPHPAHTSAQTQAQPESPLSLHSRQPKKNPLAQTSDTSEPVNHLLAVDSPRSQFQGPQAIDTPLPQIPESFQQTDLKTYVLLKLNISTVGEVTPTLQQSSGYPLLDELALSTVKRWKFYPAERQGLPIDSQIRIRLNFLVQE